MFLLILLKVIWENLNSLKEKVHNLCPLYTFLMKNYWKSPLHAKIVYNLRVCHDLDPMSFVQGQGHKKCKVSV